MKMKIGFLICLCFAAIAAYGNAKPSPVPVASKGETSIRAAKVRVEIRTHEVVIGKPSDERPSVINSNCTYSKYPCSIVDDLSITVDGKPLFVPRSVFSDLADLNSAEIDTEGKQSNLILLGGDASESYVLTISFDAEQVKKRVLSSATLPNQPLQETTYHALVEGD